MKQRLLLLSFMLLAITAGFSQTAATVNPPVTKEYPKDFEKTDKAVSKLYDSGPYAKFKDKIEILSKRTETSKFFDNGDGTITAMLTAGPCHYLEDGLYHTSTNEVLPYSNPMFPGYVLANVNNKNKSLFSSADMLFLLGGFNSGNTITYTKGGVEVLDYSKTVTSHIALNNTEPVINFSSEKNGGGEHNNVLYPSVAPGMNYEVEQLAYKVKTQYVLNDSTFLNSIPDGASYLGFKELFKFSKPVTTKETDFKGGLKGTGFYNGDKLLLNINETRFFDKKPGTPKNDMEVKITKISDFEYEVIYIVPVQWLKDAGRVYPIYIDPTLTMTPTASTYWTGTTNEDADAVSSDVMIEGFYDCSGCDDEEWASYAKFNTSGLPNTNCIITGNFYLYQYGWNNGSGNDQLQFDVGWLNLDPVPSSWVAIRDGINNLPERYSRWNVWGGIGACGGCNGGWDFNEGCCGWDDFLVNYPLFRNRVSWSAGQDYLSIGLDNIVGNNDCYWCWNDETNELAFYGWSNTSRPQITVDYADNANNACASAYATTSGGSYAYDTRCATYDGPSMNCAGATNPMNLWYYYTAPSYGTLTVANCGSSFDTKINVFAGSCAGIQVGCNDDFCGTSSSVSINVCAGETYYISVGGYSASGSGSGTFTVNFTAGTAPGNPAVFGNGVWNVYGYRGGNINLTGAYCGYYTESNLTYSSLNRWTSAGSPSDASGWQGCYVPIDNHVIVSKRTGFTCGNYQLNINTHDDDIQVYVNGNLIFNEVGCCHVHNNIWTGYLGPASTIEVRTLEGGGGSNQGLDVTMLSSAPGNPATFGNGTWNVYGYAGGDLSLNGTYYGYYTEGNLSYNSTNRWSSAGSPSDASGWQGCYVPVDNHVVVSKRTNFTCGKYQIDVSYHDDDAQLYVDGSLVWQHIGGCCDTHTNIWTGYLSSGSTVEFRHLEGGGGSGQGITFTNVTPAITNGNMTINGTAGNITVCQGSSFTIAQNGGSFPDATYCYWIGTNNGSGWVNAWDYWNQVNCNTTSVTSPTFNTPGSYVIHTNGYNNTCGWAYAGAGVTRILTVIADPTWATNTFTPTSGSTICVGAGVTFSATVSGGSGGSVSWVRATSPGGAGTTVTSGDVPPSAGTYYYRPVYTPSVSGCNLADGTERTVIVVADPTWATNTFTPTSGSTICVGGAVTFSATVSGGSGGSVSWVRATTPGGAGTTVTSGDVPPSTGTYYYRPVYTPSVSGCNLADGTERTVTVVADPTWATNTFTPTSGSTICAGGSVTFSATVSGGSGGSVSWVRATTSGGAGTTVTSGDVPPSAGTYYYRPVYTPSVGGCNLADGTERTVIVVADPTWATNTFTPTSGSTICVGGSVTFSATVSGGSGGSVSWVRATSPGGAGTAVTSGDVPPSAGTYYYRPQYTATVGGCNLADGTESSVIVVADPTWATNTFTPTSGSTICAGGSVTFSATVSGGSGGSVSWVRATTSGGAGTTVTSGDVPPSTGTYYYRPVYTPSVGGCNLADGTERTVIVVADPTWATNTFTPTSGSTICVGGSVTFSATVSGGSGGTVGWVRATSPGGAGTAVTSGDVPPAAGTYYYRPQYTATVGGCDLADGTESSVIVVADPTWATNTFTPTSGSTICAGGAVTFSATVSGGSGGSVSWVRATTSGGAGTTVTSGDVPPSTGTYYYRPVYTPSIGGCNLADGTERTVTVVTDPTWATNTFTPTSGSTICAGGSVTFSATVSGGSGGSVSWVRATTSGGAGTTVTSGDVPPSAGTYYYRPVYTPSVGGCDLADGTERTVIVVADPTWATNTVSSSPVCLGSAVTFSATVSGGSGGTVSWVRSTTSGGAGTTVTSGDVPPSTGTYYYRPQYTATVGGCNLADGTETAVVVSPAAANRTVTAASSTVCSGGTTTLTVVSSESGTSYQLYNVTTAANEGSAQAGNGANLVFTTSPIFSPTTYRIIGTRSPCSGIAMNSGSTDFAIGTQTGPIQRTVQVVSSTICNNTAGGVQLLNSESGTVYQLYNETDAVNVGATQTGNGTTLTFSTGNLTADKSFKIIASRNPCTAVDMNNGATVDIYVVGNNTWKGSVSTDWFDGNNWCLGGGIPTSTTDVVIPNGATTNFDPIINANGAVCRTISINTSGILTISGTRNLDVYGDWDNSGVFNYNASTVTFKGTSTANIGGFTDPQEFNNLKVDKGTTNTPVLDMGTNVTVYGALQPTNGTARISAGDLVLSSATTIASTAGVEVGGGNLVAGSLAFTNNGLFKVSTGNADVASLTNNSGSAYQTTGGITTIAGSVTNTGSTITAGGGSVTVSGNWSNASSTTATYSGSTIAVVGNYSSAGSSVVNANSATVSVGGNYTNTSSTLNLSGAIVSVGGNMVNAAGTVNQNGGAITLNTTGSSFNSNAVLDFDGASSMNISAGNIYLERANGGTGNDLVILSGAGTKTITGGTIHFGNGFTPASQVFKVNNSVVDFNNLTIAGNNAPTLRLLANAATRSTGVLTVNGVFDLNQFTFTVKNSATSAVTASGYILSEATNGNSKLAWNIGNNIGSYVFPFGNASGVTIPFTFNITTAGVENGTGNVTVSTYPSADDNTPWVSSVGHMNFDNGNGNGTDATLDRWWIIDANNYTTKPVSSMTFKYADADLSGNGSIIEGVLKAQRWNATGGPLSSGGWDDPYAFGGTNTNNAGNNTVTVTGVSNYSPWVLHDGESGGNSPLPVELVDFKAACDNNVVTLNWTTASETNDDYFTIQRSADLVNFENVAVVDGAGNSNVYINYTAKDHYPLAGTSYYRLMQTDYNGQSEIFNPIAVTCLTGDNDVISVFPNPANDKLNVTMQLSSSDRGRIIIYNHFGQQVESLFVEPKAGYNTYSFDLGTLAQGQYMVSFMMDGKVLPTQKVIISR